MANAAEASASTARPKKKRQRRVKHQQQERTEPTRGQLKDEKVSPADSPSTNQYRNLGAPCQPQCLPSRNWKKHEMEGTGERSVKEKTDESRNLQRVRIAGPRLAVGLLGTRGKNDEDKENDHGAVPSGKTGRPRGRRCGSWPAFQAKPQK